MVPISPARRCMIRGEHLDDRRVDEHRPRGSHGDAVAERQGARRGREDDWRQLILPARRCMIRRRTPGRPSRH